MLKIVPSNQFKKDLKLAKKRGCKIENLQDVVTTLANKQKLLVYRISQDALELFLFRTGTHYDLF